MWNLLLGWVEKSRLSSSWAWNDWIFKSSWVVWSNTFDSASVLVVILDFYASKAKALASLVEVRNIGKSVYLLSGAERDSSPIMHLVRKAFCVARFILTAILNWEYIYVVFQNLVKLRSHLGLLRLNTCDGCSQLELETVCFGSKWNWLCSFLLTGPLRVCKYLLLQLLNIHKSWWNRESDRLIIYSGPHLKYFSSKGSRGH
jgi:hypothetical protein